MLQLALELGVLPIPSATPHQYHASVARMRRGGPKARYLSSDDLGAGLEDLVVERRLLGEALALWGQPQ